MFNITLQGFKYVYMLVKFHHAKGNYSEKQNQRILCVVLKQSAM